MYICMKKQASLLILYNNLHGRALADNMSQVKKCVKIEQEIQKAIKEPEFYPYTIIPNPPVGAEGISFKSSEII